jgi:hypothetical protein
VAPEEIPEAVPPRSDGDGSSGSLNRGSSSTSEGMCPPRQWVDATHPGSRQSESSIGTTKRNSLTVSSKSVRNNGRLSIIQNKHKLVANVSRAPRRGSRRLADGGLRQSGADALGRGWRFGAGNVRGRARCAGHDGRPIV